MRAITTLAALGVVCTVGAASAHPTGDGHHRLNGRFVSHAELERQFYAPPRPYGHHGYRAPRYQPQPAYRPYQQQAYQPQYVPQPAPQYQQPYAPQPYQQQPYAYPPQPSYGGGYQPAPSYQQGPQVYGGFDTRGKGPSTESVIFGYAGGATYFEGNDLVVNGVRNFKSPQRD